MWTKRKFKQLLEKIEKQVGIVISYPKRSAFEVLIATIISQHTRSEHTALAMQNLRRRFVLKPNVLARASIDEIGQCIRTAGLFRKKSQVIKEVSIEIENRFGGDLESILELPLDQARELLLTLPGIGFKTADVVLSAVGKKSILAIDTHIERWSKRVGLVNENAHYEVIRRTLERYITPDDMFKVHLLLIQFGRRICKPRYPLCHQCVIAMHCKYGQTTMNS